MASGAPGFRVRAWGAAGLVLLLAAVGAGCMPPQPISRGGLDSLRTVVDTIAVRDSVIYQMLLETRRELAQQRDILLSTRATTGSTYKDVYDQMGRLQGELQEVLGRFSQVEARSGTSAPPSNGPNPTTIYDQATQDLTQGRYTLALQGFRDFLQRAPGGELADNAQYGVGECYFAQSKFDSAAVEYARVEQLAPQGDKVPAALYKLALSQEKLGQTAQSKKTLEALVQRFPQSGEAQLARERLGTARKR